MKLKKLVNKLNDPNILRKYFSSKELIFLYKAGERNFSEIDVNHTKLDGADLSGSNLSEVLFYGTSLIKTNLTKTNLTNATLYGANLKEANLFEAILTETDLVYADFTDANLQGTCLDPKAPVPETDLSELWIEGNYVIGYRTKKSLHCSLTIYEPGSHHIAPWFSICTKTACHPGIHLYSPYQIQEYPYIPYVKVKALKSETIKVGYSYRAKQIWVLEDF